MLAVSQHLGDDYFPIPLYKKMNSKIDPLGENSGIWDKIHFQFHAIQYFSVLLFLPRLC